MEYVYEIEMKVRDYECDLQGVVNNSVYQNYFEHARHEFLETTGYNFGKLHEMGIDAMVAKVEISYKNSLKSGDFFVVKLNMCRKGPKLIFNEDIFRISDNILCCSGIITSVSVENGKLTKGDIFDKVFSSYLNKK